MPNMSTFAYSTSHVKYIYEHKDGTSFVFCKTSCREQEESLKNLAL